MSNPAPATATASVATAAPAAVVTPATDHHHNPLVNEYGQRVGPIVPGWTTRPLPDRNVTLKGKLCTLVPLRPGPHATELWQQYTKIPDWRKEFTYVATEPPEGEAEWQRWAATIAADNKKFWWYILDNNSSTAVGSFGLTRCQPAHGVAEVSGVHFTDAMKRRPIGTEAYLLLSEYVFDTLGYRTLEWRCHTLNKASWRAALRLGSTFVGVKRNCWVMKGRSRDSAFFYILDDHWRGVAKPAIKAWLDPSNFDENGIQRARLEDIRNRMELQLKTSPPARDAETAAGSAS